MADPVGALAAPNVFETMRDNIAQLESGGRYDRLGKKLPSGDQAIGKYQVMASNVPSWTRKWYGKPMTAEQFRASPEAQEAVFKGEFGSYLASGTPGDAASKWFTGRPLSEGANRKDILGTSGAKYAAIATKGLGSDAVTTRGPSRPVTPTPATAPAAATVAVPATAPTDDRSWWDKAYGKLVTAPVDEKGNPTGKSSPMEVFQETLARNQANQRAAMEAQAPSDPGFGSQGPGARNVSPGLANIAQTYGQTLNSFMQPMTWNSAPPGRTGTPVGSQTWVRPVPGVSLSSVQAPSQGLGYGIEPVGYGYG